MRRQAENQELRIDRDWLHAFGGALDAPLPVALEKERDQSDQLTLTYEDTIRRRLAEVLKLRPSSGEIPFDLMRGAWPARVVDLADKYSFATFRDAHSVLSNSEDRVFNPELHPLSFEWYFTEVTARDLAQNLVSRSEDTICMGVPTVAEKAIKSGSRISLIDSSPFVLKRFGHAISPSVLQNKDIAHIGNDHESGDLIIFDAPWNFVDTLCWLAAAARIVKPGGRIVFSLFPSLVRPSAELERQFILSIASQIGSVEEASSAIEYQTPLFELEALACSGLAHVGNWRRGDLVAINVFHNHRSERFIIPPRPVQSPEWTTVVIGAQQVRVKQGPATVGDTGLFSKLATLEDYRFPSVSARDHRRQEIGLWTSRNRVAQVHDPDSTVRILSSIANGASVRDAVAADGLIGASCATFETEIHRLLAVH